LTALRWRSWSERRTLKLLKSTPCLESAEEAPLGGVVKVVGRIQSDSSLLEAPLTARRCVFYEVVVEERRGSSGSKVILRESRAVKFVVTNGEHRARFRTDRISVISANEAFFESGFLNDATPRLESFLTRNGQSSERIGLLCINRALSFTERRLELED